MSIKRNKTFYCTSKNEEQRPPSPPKKLFIFHRNLYIRVGGRRGGSTQALYKKSGRGQAFLMEILVIVGVLFGS
jgi:hypothetical protein